MITRYLFLLEESSLDMTPEVLYQFPPSVILSTQQAKQQALVASFDLLTNVFQVSFLKRHVDLVATISYEASPDGWVVWRVVDHCVLRNWDRILVRAVKGLISRAGMVSICPLLWQRDVKLQQTTTISYEVERSAMIIIPIWCCWHNLPKTQEWGHASNSINISAITFKFYCYWHSTSRYANSPLATFFRKKII